MFLKIIPSGGCMIVKNDSSFPKHGYSNSIAHQIDQENKHVTTASTRTPNRANARSGTREAGRYRRMNIDENTKS